MLKLVLKVPRMPTACKAGPAARAREVWGTSRKEYRLSVHPETYLYFVSPPLEGTEAAVKCVVRLSSAVWQSLNLQFPQFVFPKVGECLLGTCCAFSTVGHEVKWSFLVS
jgi:hypothetical protein